MQAVYMVVEEDAIEGYYVVQDNYALFTSEEVAQEVADSLNKNKASGEVEYKVVPLTLNSVKSAAEAWHPVHYRPSASEQRASKKASTGKVSGPSKSTKVSKAKEPVPDLMAALEASLARANKPTTT